MQSPGNLMLLHRMKARPRDHLGPGPPFGTRDHLGPGPIGPRGPFGPQGTVGPSGPSGQINHRFVFCLVNFFGALPLESDASLGI